MTGPATPDSPSSHELQSKLRREEARALAADVIRRRAAGEVLPDESVIAEHLSLMPELAEALQHVREIHQVALAARKAGSNEQAVSILSAEDLDAPIGALAGETLEDRGPGDAPRVEGFTLLNEIGRGGQAVVYRAVQDSTGRRVALKVLAGGTDVESEHRARFEREVRTLATLDHPHIVGIIDRGRTHSGAFYLAMELVEGWTFDEFAAECRTVDDKHPRMLLTAMIKVARAVHAAHEQGVIHRDLKPSNVRVDRRGEPRVLDFGLAKIVDSDQPVVTTTGQWVGSLPWFSPEVANHGQKAADRRSDVYALGVVFYQALAGKYPYNTEGPLTDVLKRICHAQPEPLQLPHSHLPVAAINAVLLKALAKAPVERYASAGALADDLEAILRGSHTVAGRHARRRRRRGIMAVVALLIILANAAWWFWPQIAPAEYALPQMENRFGMRLITIPAGDFWMGSPEEERLSKRDETHHQVAFRHSYWLGATEVTRGQYAAVLELPAPPAAQADLPVVNLSRDDAVAFCRKLTQIDGRQYRLPTEAEWEYACKTSSSMGADKYPIQEQAWVMGNALGKPHPVATRRPNAWGLHDMLGNAQEWVLDDYAPLTEKTVVDPLAYVGDDGRGILKGGDYSTFPARCRPAAREPYLANRRNSTAGFRVVLDIAKSPSTRVSH